jgi:ClpP class serine protease
MPGNSHIFVQQFSRLGSIGPRTLRYTAATEMLRNDVHPKLSPIASETAARA